MGSPEHTSGGNLESWIRFVVRALDAKIRRHSPHRQAAPLVVEDDAQSGTSIRAVLECAVANHVFHGQRRVDEDVTSAFAGDRYRRLKKEPGGDRHFPWIN